MGNVSTSRAKTLLRCFPPLRSQVEVDEDTYQTFQATVSSITITTMDSDTDMEIISLSSDDDDDEVEELEVCFKRPYYGRGHESESERLEMLSNYPIMLAPAGPKPPLDESDDKKYTDVIKNAKLQQTYDVIKETSAYGDMHGLAVAVGCTSKMVACTKHKLFTEDKRHEKNLRDLKMNRQMRGIGRGAGTRTDPIDFTEMWWLD